MKTTLIKYSSNLQTWCLILFLASTTPFTFAQDETAIKATTQFPSAFPELPFNLQIAANKHYSRITQWYESYQKGETDESGSTWSIPKENYQAVVYQLSNGEIETTTYYDPNNNRLRRLDYYYLNKLLSAIDEIAFDSTTGKEVLVWTDVYFYENNGVPFQRTREFKKERSFREIVSFRFDNEKRPTRTKSEFVGAATKPSTLALIGDGRQQILWSYGGGTMRKSIYHNYSDLSEVYEIEYEMPEQPKTTKVLDENYHVKYSITHEYQDGKLVKDVYATEYEKSSEFGKVVYYFYDADGMLEKKMVEQGDLQEIFLYSYTAE